VRANAARKERDLAAAVAVRDEVGLTSFFVFVFRCCLTPGAWTRNQRNQRWSGFCRPSFPSCAAAATALDTPPPPPPHTWRSRMTSRERRMRNTPDAAASAEVTGRRSDAGGGGGADAQKGGMVCGVGGRGLGVRRWGVPPLPRPRPQPLRLPPS
jgi:hypothetical protein